MESQNVMPTTPRSRSNRSFRVHRTRKVGIAHEPTLPSIRMVESTIKKSNEYPSKYKLWRALPKSMQYPTLEKILNYLESSNKIMIGKDGSIIWIFADSPELKGLLHKSTKLR